MPSLGEGGLLLGEPEGIPIGEVLPHLSKEKLCLSEAVCLGGGLITSTSPRAPQMDLLIVERAAQRQYIRRT